jgi:predicted alpha/beta superfamily hydrolase
MMDSDQNAATMATIIRDSFTHRIQSSHVDGMEYLINVHLPPTYGMNEDSYPVIYYPDAFFATEFTTGTKKILELSGKIASTILVGISQEGDFMRVTSDRCRDLTPTHVPQDKILVYAEGAPVSGGADHFLAFIEHELLPFVEKEYRVDTSNRGFIGSSYGGLFAAWTMVNRPQLFQRYILTSPALYWDDYLFFKQEEELWQKSQTLNAKVYVSAGEKEVEPFLQSVIRFNERFTAHNYQGFEFAFHIMRERDHETSYLEALLNGLLYLYGSSHPTG